MQRHELETSGEASAADSRSAPSSDDVPTSSGTARSALAGGEPLLIDSEQVSPSSAFHVVGVGASAGGLDALEQFFQAMPEDTGMAFVVIQHLSPDFKSVMDELLARRTKI